LRVAAETVADLVVAIADGGSHSTSKSRSSFVDNAGLQHLACKDAYANAYQRKTSKDRGMDSTRRQAPFRMAG
jgi:hypothetical protein